MIAILKFLEKTQIHHFEIRIFKLPTLDLSNNSKLNKHFYNYQTIFLKTKKVAFWYTAKKLHHKILRFSKFLNFSLLSRKKNL